MGNISDKEIHSNNESDINHLDFFFAKKQDKQQEIIDKIKENIKYPKNYEKYVNVFIDKRTGRQMPYMSDTVSEMPMSENPRYIEFIVCESNGKKTNEKVSTHDCDGDCNCVTKMIDINSPFISVSKKMKGGENNSESELSSERNRDIIFEGSDEDTDEDSDIEPNDLELDDEDIIEDGFVMEDSDVTSSDLYRMQNQLYDSDDEDLDEDSDTMMERVMNDMKRPTQNTMFDTEEQKIMELSSDREYIKKSFNRNPKYN